GGGSGDGSVPSDGSGTQARLAQRLLDGFGINMHVGTAGGTYLPIYQTPNLPHLIDCLSYLGTKLVRDSNNTGNFAAISQATGVKWGLFVDESAASNFGPILDGFRAFRTAHPDMVAWYEGPNEPDSGAKWTQETLQDGANFMPAMWSAGQADHVPVIQTSFGQGWDKPTGDYGVTGDLSASADYGNAHVYFDPSFLAPNEGGLYGTGTIDMIDRLARLTTPNKPVAITEFGYQTDRVAEDARADYILTFIFDAFWRWHDPYYVYYAMFDDGSGNWGLFDDNFSPRASAVALHNLYQLLADSDGAAQTFAPGRLDFSFAGLPPGDNAGMGGQTALLQKSDGSFWVVAWNEQNRANGSTPSIPVAPVTVTLQLATAATSIAVYDPRVGTAPVAQAAGAKTMAVSLPAHPILIRIVRP
ncbi:MAG: hypothetical protein LC659_00380, partial [Myxococcales bacterium]|nr:hypothetical protein [Myxococcales bacterium]